MKTVTAILALILVLLQARLWFGDSGITEVKQLSSKIAFQQQELERSKKRNAELMAQINDLRNGTRLLEELAREDLNMLKSGETFIRVVE
tara:strand:+ start:4832 stop:5101 length:270 start_codon:yes stop_codon:yes gene_type:complete